MTKQEAEQLAKEINLAISSEKFRAIAMDTRGNRNYTVSIHSIDMYIFEGEVDYHSKGCLIVLDEHKNWNTLCDMMECWSMGKANV